MSSASSPEGRLLTDLTVALARVPRGQGEGGDQSLQRAIAADACATPAEFLPRGSRRLSISAEGRSHLPLRGEIELGRAFDPLDCDLADPWTGPKPAILAELCDAPGAPTATPSSASNCWRQSWSPARSPCPKDWPATQAVLQRDRDPPQTVDRRSPVPPKSRR